MLVISCLEQPLLCVRMGGLGGSVVVLVVVWWCVCVRACVRACACVCTHVGGRAGGGCVDADSARVCGTIAIHMLV